MENINNKYNLDRLSRIKTYSRSAKDLIWEAVTDFGILVKFRLTLTVVFSSVMGFLIASSGSSSFDFRVLMFLVLGGFCITAAANALNQVLEKDYDKLMERTKHRPLPQQRMTVASAILIAGVLALFGILFLGSIGPLALLLGAIALVSYAFIYTPMKRFTNLAVVVGAIPGAIPTAIGVVAVDGSLTGYAIALFALQFFWQFPHFWAIAWLKRDDYANAGYFLLPSKGGVKDAQTGIQSIIYCVLLVALCGLMFAVGFIGWLALVLGVIITLGFTYRCWELFKYQTDLVAKRQMFYSLAYLPAMLIVLYIDKLI
jgi:protoheme IX farnesyltransferase